MRIYENIVIGSFLFELGVRMGKNRPDLPVISVNLLQQTPLDQRLGDVLLANAAMVKLIEFKRERNSSEKEKIKRAELLKDIFRQENWESLIRLSRRIHWYISINESRLPDHVFEANVIPYLDFQKSDRYISLSAFAEATAQEACSEPDATVAQSGLQYIRYASTTLEKRIADKLEGDAKSGSSCFALAYTSEGEIRWAAVPAIDQLFMTGYELYTELGIHIDPPQRTPERQREHQREIGM